MKNHWFWATAVAFCLAACGEQRTPAPVEAPPIAAPAEESDVSAEALQPEAVVDRAFIDHMHAHADHMDEMMFALSDGDLEGAMTPAYWLSRHKAVEGVPEEWQQYLVGMREAALAVESATDIDTARSAAEDISHHCQACHTAAGVITSE
jgi:hypothetical protein